MMKNINTSLNISQSAFSIISDIPRLTDFATTVKVSELFINLNGNQKSPPTQTTQTRLFKIKQNDSLDWIRRRQTKGNRITQFLAEANKVGVNSNKSPKSNQI